jgi:hypothetical protein
MPRSSPQNQAHTSPAQARNAAEIQALRSHELRPHFSWSTIDSSGVQQGNRQILIQGYETGCGMDLVRVPFRISNAGNSIGAQITEVPPGWQIDLDETTINTTTEVGGLIDGTSIASEEDMLVWAFWDPTASPKFQGFGCTTRPHRTTASIVGGTRGSIATVTVTGYGFHFNIGARVVIRTGTSSGSTHNQGLITAQTVNTLTVQMDAAYTGLNDLTNSNLSGGSKQILQLDQMAPRMFDEDSLYPGGGTEYQYSYMGSLSLDTSSNINIVRQRGDMYIFPAHYFILQKSAVGVDVATQFSFSRWCPWDASQAGGWVTMTRTSGTSTTGQIKLQTDATSSLQFLSSNMGFASSSSAVRFPFDIPLLRRNCSAYLNVDTSGGNTLVGGVGLERYLERNW